MKTSKWLRVFGLTAAMGLSYGCGDDLGAPKPDGGGADGGSADGGKKGLDGGSPDGGAVPQDGNTSVDGGRVVVDSAIDVVVVTLDANAADAARGIDSVGVDSTKDAPGTPAFDVPAVDAAADSADASPASDSSGKTDGSEVGGTGAASSPDSSIDGIAGS